MPPSIGGSIIFTNEAKDKNTLPFQTRCEYIPISSIVGLPAADGLSLAMIVIAQMARSL
jgi:hypothetical protein